ncbi:MAG: rhodanese-like domain-containing protein [Ignavibacteria bacterium]|jgi:rhodanese-related sulfurtransferase
MIINIRKYFFLIFFLCFNSCLDDSITAPFTEQPANSAELLLEIESRGDYINSDEFPAIIGPDSIYFFRDQFIIADLRSSGEFISGHIEGAVNITNSELFDFVKDNSEQGKIIAIITTTGQAGAYYASLLRFYGFDNVCSLNFGMSLWNSQFSESITSIIRSNPSPNANLFDNKQYTKPDYTELPAVAFENESASVGEKLEERIRLLINEGFTNKLLESLEFSDDNYIFCFGNSEAYYLAKSSNTTFPSHPIGAPLYSAFYPKDLRSTKYLQTIPSTKKITVYSYSGQLSAAALSLLNVLGYDAVSLNYGLHKTSYAIIGGSRSGDFFVFTENKIRNYSFVTGQ